MRRRKKLSCMVDNDENDSYFDGFSNCLKSNQYSGKHRVMPHTWQGPRNFQEQLDSLKELAMAFIQNFATSRIQGKDINSLMSRRKNYGESIRSIIKRFAKKKIEAKNINQATTIATVIKDMRLRGMKDLLVKSRPQTWEQLIVKLNKYIRVEETQQEMNKRKKQLWIPSIQYPSPEIAASFPYGRACPCVG